MLHPEVFQASAGRSPEQVQQVKSIMRNIEDAGFWCKLTELKIYLEPLVIAVDVAQAPTTRLDNILIELRRLYYTFSRFTMNVAVMSTLLNLSSLYGFAKRVFRRIFRKDNNLEMQDAFMDYLDGKNEFHPDQWDFQEVRALCEQSGKPVNLVHVWSDLLTSNASNNGSQQLVHLAINVLSIIANSVGCERLFSKMGYTQSKQWSRLSNEKTFDTAVVQMELKQKHTAAGLMCAHLHQQFGISVEKRETVPLLPDAETKDQHNEMAEELAEIDVDEGSGTYRIRNLADKLAQDVIDDKDPPEDNIANDAGSPLVEPEQLAKSGPLPKCLWLFFGTQYPILLKDLFNYSTPGLEGQGLNIFKNAGLSNLQKELEVYDLLTQDVQ